MYLVQWLVLLLVSLLRHLSCLVWVIGTSFNGGAFPLKKQAFFRLEKDLFSGWCIAALMSLLSSARWLLVMSQEGEDEGWYPTFCPVRWCHQFNTTLWCSRGMNFIQAAGPEGKDGWWGADSGNNDKSNSRSQTGFSAHGVPRALIK